MSDSTAVIRRACEILSREFGPQRWWPGGGPFEVMVGAVLTQNTSWRNVERALEGFRDVGVLAPGPLAALSLERVEELTRPAGSWRRKARTIEYLTAEVVAHPGGLAGLLSLDASELRDRLLGIVGIGPETADAILLYAARHPVFVVDAYARRFAERHGIAEPSSSYGEVQALFERALGGDEERLNESHALMVELGKRYCRPTPRCQECPLRAELPPRAGLPGPRAELPGPSADGA